MKAEVPPKKIIFESNVVETFDHRLLNFKDYVLPVAELGLLQVDEEWWSAVGALAAGVWFGSLEAAVGCVDGVCGGLEFADE